MKAETENESVLNLVQPDRDFYQTGLELIQNVKGQSLKY